MLFIAIFASCYSSLLAQIDTPLSVSDSLVADTIWTTSTRFGINFNQAAFSDNWTGGAVNSVAFSGLFNYLTSYQRGSWSWDNTVDLLYGVINNQGQGIRKSQDRIFLDSKVGYDISEDWNGYGSLNFLTQFAPGFRYVALPSGREDGVRISNLLAPAFLTLSLGFEYMPNKNFSLRLSPFSPRITIVNDTTLYNNLESSMNGTAYGVESREGETIRYEWLAFQLLMSWNKSITENIGFQARYLTFTNYEQLSFDQIDHRLDLTITAKLTQYINVNFSGIALYDFDQTEELQFSQLIGVGILLSREKAVVD
ncbi:MAG: DUF3078 domain-containing protein [Tunicatimonas sp.]|uniref:DUF3078 domain-containing protein n=1 Tax=Tunicatimonas sp. TaxID=1940096 RepID=UPI003C7316DD